MSLLPEFIPHTRKDVDTTRPFFTFRFVGGLVALRRALYQDVGGFSPEFFYGLEEREYSYRIIKAGWKILYQPDIVAIETTDEGGRASRIDQRTETLSNRYIISYLHTPLAPMIANFVLFTLFLVIKERGRVNVGRALGKFSTWLKKPGRPARRPIDRHAQAYIRACGGRYGGERFRPQRWVVCRPQLSLANPLAALWLASWRRHGLFAVSAGVTLAFHPGTCARLRQTFRFAARRATAQLDSHRS
uniref:Galactosyltransferase C-terminal domain-containing protein n=1 Tax=Phenylobacterium glaciei TaxID=2803784 RepID=A0A974P6Z3_9CAUL|nr:hypothetical protein JKL49_11525 [Phenylobacterium glaciei]